MSRRAAKFDKRGKLGILAGAFDQFFSLDALSLEPFSMEGKCAVVDICGPLTHHDEFFFDSYDSIRGRVTKAIESDAACVVLNIDSPGGEVSGCFELAREMRALADEKKKPILAYVDGMAASAAYALACIGDQIFCPPSAIVGSIGVIEVMCDTTALDRAMGIKFSVISSGARKADSNPHVPITDSAIEAAQRDIDGMAKLFFDWVGERRGMSSDEVRALQAACFTGQAGVDAKLADNTQTKNDLLSMVESSAITSAPIGAMEAAMGWKDMMKKAAEDGDEEAKKALLAVSDDKEEETDDEKKKKDDEAKAKAAEEEKEKSAKAAEDEKKEKEAAAARAKMLATSADPAMVALAGEVQKLSAINEANARKEIMSSRPDIKNPVILGMLAKEPVEGLQALIDKIEKPKAAHNPAAAAMVQGTAGDREHVSTPAHQQTMSEKIDERMGVTKANATFKWDGNDRVLPHNLSKDEARAVLERNTKRAAVGGAK